MKKIQKNDILPITVVVPMRNADSTITETLEGIRIQEYPVKKVIVVDNASTDSSVKVTKAYAKRYPKMNIRIIENPVNMMVAKSFNTGIKAAKTEYIVAMHGDCRFATKHDLRKLVTPLENDRSIVATYGRINTPVEIWNKYAFWEKCLFAPYVGKHTSGLVGKIDCYRKDVILRIGGYDEKVHGEIGGEDANLYMKLKDTGKIVATNALVLHLHYLHKDFSLRHLMDKKKAIAKTYGLLLRLYGLRLGAWGIAIFLFKPFLAIGSFVPVLNTLVLPLLVVFPFWYFRKMFTSAISLKDPRIFILPIVGIFLVFYETFWTLEAFIAFRHQS